jgi:hypothetical protein
MSEGNGSERIDANLELVKQMGSRNGYDPIPPSQYLYFLDDPDPVQRVVAFIRSRTIRLGHRTPHATESDGTDSTIQSLANVCFNGHWANANRAWQEAQSRKLVYKDRQDRLCLSGNVPSRESQRVTRLKSITSEADGSCTEWSKFCTEWSPPAYIREEFERRDDQAREEFARRYAGHLTWAAKLEADAIAAARIEADKREKLLFAKFGLKPHTNGKKRDLEAKPLCVQLKLLDETEPDGVPNDAVRDDGRPVQSAGGNLYRPENGTVQDARPEPSLYTEQRTTTEEISSSSEVPLTVEVKAEEEEAPPLEKEPVRALVPVAALNAAPKPAPLPPTYETFKALYPKRRFDEGKARPRFNAMSFRERAEVIEHLVKYLACPRWQQDNGQYVPFASKWIQTHDAEPPPPFTLSKAAVAGGRPSLAERTIASIKDNMARGQRPI